MPLEIKELHIKVTINAEQPSSSGAVKGSNQGSSTSTKKLDNEALIAACVERVCEILEEKMED